MQEYGGGTWEEESPDKAIRVQKKKQRKKAKKLARRKQAEQEAKYHTDDLGELEYADKSLSEDKPVAVGGDAVQVWVIVVQCCVIL